MTDGYPAIRRIVHEPLSELQDLEEAGETVDLELSDESGADVGTISIGNTGGESYRIEFENGRTLRYERDANNDVIAFALDANGELLASEQVGSVATGYSIASSVLRQLDWYTELAAEGWPDEAEVPPHFETLASDGDP